MHLSLWLLLSLDMDVLLLGGALLLLLFYKRVGEIAWLQEYGERIMATIVQIKSES